METYDSNIARLLEDHIRFIYSLSFRFCADVQMAEDLAQQTLLSAWEKRTQLSDMKKISGWLRRICLNLYLSSKRKEGIIMQPEDGFEEAYADISPLPEQELVVEESVRELQDGCFTAMTSRLTLAQRSAFILVDMLGLSIEEAARMLELSVSSLKSLLFRARKNLNAFFGHHCQWVLPENSCSCQAWYEFSRHREQLREQVRKHGGPPDFTDPRYGEKSDPATMQKVLSLFRNLPERRPDISWYEKTALLVGGLLIEK
ncbi:MAG: RNA polymerase sigma factor [Spirochaetales bacterium]|nr:RNA polymerase sigma factor [Spirochaetales bacterium]